MSLKAPLTPPAMLFVGQDKSGDTGFVGDNGKFSKISNPDMVKGKMGQKVKAKCRMSHDNDKEAMKSIELIWANAG